jgi:urease gamma subunit
MAKSHKLYCYVDETGQDTQGRLFIVVAVVVADERHKLDMYLEEAEKASGIGKKKWVRAKAAPESRDQYLESVGAGDFRNKLFYSKYTETGTGAYEHLTVLAIAQAVNQYREKHRLKDEYKVSVTIDGLKRSEETRVGKQLRELGIKSRKIRGARDASEPLIRLADRIAGLVRDADDKGKTYQTLRRHLEKRGIINKL